MLEPLQPAAILFDIRLGFFGAHFDAGALRKFHTSVGLGRQLPLLQGIRMWVRASLGRLPQKVSGPVDPEHRLFGNFHFTRNIRRYLSVSEKGGFVTWAAHSYDSTYRGVRIPSLLCTISTHKGGWRWDGVTQKKTTRMTQIETWAPTIYTVYYNSGGPSFPTIAYTPPPPRCTAAR